MQQPFKNLAPLLKELIAKLENFIGVISFLKPKYVFGCAENFSSNSNLSGISIKALIAKPKGKFCFYKLDETPL